jgi:hypothetical protein
LYFYKNEIIISDPHLLSNLEHAGELFLERDSLSLAALKLAALLKSLLKLLTLLSAGLSV